MSAFSSYLENKTLDHILGGGDYSRPATVYLALFTAAPTESGGGTEVSGGSYARLAITNNSTNFPAASGGSKSNGTAITLGPASAGWGTVSHWAIFDASTGGNMLYFGACGSAKAIDTSDSFTIAASQLTITLD